jgi:hypothetical protein
MTVSKINLPLPEFRMRQMTVFTRGLSWLWEMLWGAMLVGSMTRASWLTRISTQGTTPHGLGRPKEGFTMTRPTIQKILEDHGVLPKA